jgi:L-ascorbate metabolism protein UlaG (beta-lactamase superfamily)
MQSPGMDQENTDSLRIRWYGQSAFLLEHQGRRVFVDPFGDMSGLAARGLRFDYPKIEGVSADLLLVTHEHGDHNGVDAIGGDPQTIRSTAGSYDDAGVVGIASEHDDVAGTRRGPNTIFRFDFGGARIAHLGDFGQTGLRHEQRAAIGDIDILFVPVGGFATIGGGRAAEVVQELAPRLVVPMHYRTAALSFLEPPDEFLQALGAPVTETESEFDGTLDGVVLPAVPA